jgi:hypothetical protein
MHHAIGCGSAATPDVVEAVRPQLEMMAMRPHLGPDGQPWLDQEYGAPMTLTGHIEALTGVRLGDASLLESHRGQRRPLAQPQRPQVFGDPDDPDAAPQPFPADTARSAAALLGQAGIRTAADAARQRAAWVAEHARQTARIGPAPAPRLPRRPEQPGTPRVRPGTVRRRAVERQPPGVRGRCAMMPDEPFPGGRNPVLDGDGQPTIEDLTSTRPSASPADIRAAVDAQLGTWPNPVQRTPEHPGIHQLAQDLGLA